MHEFCISAVHTGVCPKLTNLINGVLRISSYFMGGVATYDCDDGFGLLGPATRNCLSNGTWSIVSTRCERELLMYIKRTTTPLYYVKSTHKTLSSFRFSL